MNSALLLARAVGLGLRIAEEGGRLRVEGHALTDDLVAEIRAAKAEILELLRRGASAAPEIEAPIDASAGALWEQSGPWRWANPENSPEDRALLSAIDRLDSRPSPETPPEKAVSSCFGCGDRDWWRAHHGAQLFCRRCHPAAPDAEVS